MTSLIRTIGTTLRHIAVDIKHASRVAGWVDQILAQQLPRTAPIPLASTGLATATLIGVGTSTLVGYGAGKAAECFFQHINPNYTALAGMVVFGAMALKKLSDWATMQFQHLTVMHHIATLNKTPYFIEKRGAPLGLERYSYKYSLQDQTRDFLYRKLYVIYGIVSNMQPAKSMAELQDRLTQAVDLLDRHLPQDLSNDKKAILFEYFNDQERADLIEEAKIELQSDLILYHNLTPVQSETPPFIQKRGAPLKLAAKELTLSPEFPLRWYQSLYLMNYQKSAHDFLYRRLYAMYEIVGNGKPAQSYVEFKDRMDKAVELLDRHLSQGLTEDEKIVFFEHLNDQSRAHLIKEAKIELQIDMGQHLNLTPAYAEIVRRATTKEKLALEIRLNSLPKTKETIQTLLGALEKGDWDAEIFQNKDFPYYALEAVRRGELSQNDYATVLIFWEMTQLHPNANSRKTIPIFNPDGTVNDEAKELILKTLKHDKKNNQSCLLTAEQIDQLFEKIKKLPKHQQQIWIVTHIRERIMEEIHTPVLAELDRKKMMVAPLGLMQAFLDVAFGENAVQLNAVHGLSSWNDIRQNHIDGKRDIAIHCPGIELPEKADGHSARWFYFGKHDFYHALVISSIPKVFRMVYVACYDIIQKLLKTPDANKGAMLIDMEARLFFDHFNDKKESLNDVFWAELANLIAYTVNNEQAQEALKTPSPTPFTSVDQKKLEDETKLKEKLYTDQIVSHLAPIPEIQEGAHAVFQKAQDNKPFFGKPEILEALSEMWPHLDAINLNTLFESR